MVHFVGAGPGAKDLITLRGKKQIEEADVIIYAGSLVNPELLDYAKEGAAIYNSASMDLEEVLSVIFAAEQEGKETVRLHTGDPSIYGAIREQMDRLKEAGISYEVCPGVSSFFAAAAALQTEYTLPDVSQTVIITRQAGRTGVPERQSIRELAAHHATMVLFLSSGQAKKVEEELLLGGYEKDTPVAIVYKASWPEEKVIRGTLEELAALAEKNQIRKTALIIVGWVLGDDYSLSKLYDASFETEFRKASYGKSE